MPVLKFETAVEYEIWATVQWLQIATFNFSCRNVYNSRYERFRSRTLRSCAPDKKPKRPWQVLDSNIIYILKLLITVSCHVTGQRVGLWALFIFERGSLSMLRRPKVVSTLLHNITSCCTSDEITCGGYFRIDLQRANRQHSIIIL